MATGECKIENLPVGEYNVTASKEGYGTQTKVVVVKTGVIATADLVTTVDFVLEEEVPIKCTQSVLVLDKETNYGLKEAKVTVKDRTTGLVVGSCTTKLDGRGVIDLEKGQALTATASKAGYEAISESTHEFTACGYGITLKLREIEMSDKVSVTATSDLFLWYFDSAGSAKIPCTRDNPVKKGERFSIAVSEGGDADNTTLIAPFITLSDEIRVPIEKELVYAPAHLKGMYKGDVVIKGRAGTIHVTITKYPITIPAITKKVKISCNQDANIYVNGELKTSALGRLTKVLHELR